MKAKFTDPMLAEMLLATGDAELIEGNNWGDCYWGRVDGEEMIFFIIAAFALGFGVGRIVGAISK